MCGIVGVYNHHSAAELASKAMFAEQHRGQESCGIAVSDSKIIRVRKKLGLVKEVFPPAQIDRLPGNLAIGHVRYPTRGVASEFNSQPHVVELLAGPCFSLVSNGDIVNYEKVRLQLESHGVYFSSHNDGELILKYIVYQIEKEKMPIIEAIRFCMKNVRGAYSTALITRDELYIFRDPYGFKPLSYGITDGNTVVVASETCALDIVQARYVSYVKPGEIIIINKEGIKRIENDLKEYRLNSDYPQHCIFEHIYFSRPDSYQFSEDVYRVRERIGEKIALNDHDITPDLVVPVPDSSNFIALGYANARKMPITLGLIRNHYIGRTFIKPDQTVRDESVRQKFNYLPHTFEGKSIVLIDDSIVRGTTIKKIIDLVREAGAKEIHLRIGSPPVKYACYYGIDIQESEELIANRMSIEKIIRDFGISSLKYISLQDLFSAVSKPKHYCDACFSGKYVVV